MLYLRVHKFNISFEEIVWLYIVRQRIKRFYIYETMMYNTGFLYIL